MPEDGPGALLAGVRRRARPDALGARRPAPGQGPRRRLAGGALLVPCRDLRLLRGEDQRPVDARLPDPDRRSARERQPPPPDGETNPIVVEPMGNMPVIKDLGHRHGVHPLDQDPPGHPVAARRRRSSGARADRAARVDGRHHPDDRLHPVRRLRLGLPLDGGRPRVHRPGGARQGLPVRGRPARRRDPRAPLRPRAGPARDLRLHPLLRLRRRLPQGRRADGPDHAPAPPRRRRRGHPRPQQRPQPRARVREDHREEGHPRRGAAAAGVLRPGRQGQADPKPRAIKGLVGSLPTAARGLRTGRCARCRS